jgi:formamidopyrimidine-DNA glycosylase
MNNIKERHYILSPSATLLKVYHRCSGKGCTDIGKTLLKIVYVNKTGYFCESCTEDILHQGLAVVVGAGVI